MNVLTDESKNLITVFLTINHYDPYISYHKTHNTRYFRVLVEKNQCMFGKGR